MCTLQVCTSVHVPLEQSTPFPEEHASFSTGVMLQSNILLSFPLHESCLKRPVAFPCPYICPGNGAIL